MNEREGQPTGGRESGPPASPVPEFRTMLGMAEGPEPAGRGRRFGTFIVDSLCYYAVAFVFGLVLAVAVFIGYGPNVAEVVHAIPRWKLWIVGCIDVFVYYTLFEGIFARTPGKLVAVGFAPLQSTRRSRWLGSSDRPYGSRQTRSTARPVASLRSRSRSAGLLLSRRLPALRSPTRQANKASDRTHFGETFRDAPPRLGFSPRPLRGTTSASPSHRTIQRSHYRTAWGSGGTLARPHPGHLRRGRPEEEMRRTPCNNT
jgi:hypothetical protein